MTHQRCGQLLHDDFIEQRPGAAKELEKWLGKIMRQRPATDGDQDNRSSQSSESPTMQSMNTYHAGSQSAANARSQPLQKAYDVGPKSSEQAEIVVSCDQESRWLLVCGKERERVPSLSQLNVCSTINDKELFKELRRVYLQLRSRRLYWLRLRRVRSIRFVQVRSTDGI